MPLRLTCFSTHVIQMTRTEVLNLPEKYTDFLDVFSRNKAMQLPPHSPWDCAVELLPNAAPPRSKVYFLSLPETQVMENYIKEVLATGFIQLSTSPAAAGFFFIEEDLLNQCIIAYIEFLIYSRTKDQHVQHVKMELSRLRENQLYVKAEKCEFPVSNTKFLGYCVSHQGVVMDQTKVTAVTDSFCQLLSMVYPQIQSDTNTVNSSSEREA